MKKITALFMLIAALLLSVCAEQTSHSRAVYTLIDTSGVYSKQIGNAQKILKYLLALLHSSDSLALVRIDSAGFAEDNIVAKVKFDLRPSRTNAQKRAFLETIEKLEKKVKVSSYADITASMLQAIEYLNKTGAVAKYIFIFSDLKEETKKNHVRDFSINFDGIKVITLNIPQLRSDNKESREYIKRLDIWSKRVEEGGGQWRVINDYESLDKLLD